MQRRGRAFTVLTHFWDRVLFETKTMAGTWLELGALKHEKNRNFKYVEHVFSNVGNINFCQKSRL